MCCEDLLGIAGRRTYQKHIHIVLPTEVDKKLYGVWTPGVDEIRPQFLKALGVVGLSQFTRLCNMAWTSEAVPLDWQLGVVH